MLALSDEAFARICIRATGVSPKRRSRWLRELAVRLDPPRALSSRSRRGSRSRRRRERAKSSTILTAAENSASTRGRKADPPTNVPEQNICREQAARRQARARTRRKNGTGYYRLEISDKAIEGLIQQWIATGQISDEEAVRLDRLGIERELARGIEAQGDRWTR